MSTIGMLHACPPQGGSRESSGRTRDRQRVPENACPLKEGQFPNWRFFLSVSQVSNFKFEIEGAPCSPASSGRTWGLRAHFIAASRLGSCLFCM
jgi:hypothetical protein